MEIIMHVCGEAYLTRAASRLLYGKTLYTYMASHSFVQHKFIEQLLGSRHSILYNTSLMYY